MSDETQPDITTLTVQLLSAFVSNNSFAAEGLPDLIKSTRAALTATPEDTSEAISGPICQSGMHQRLLSSVVARMGDGATSAPSSGEKI